MRFKIHRGTREIGGSCVEVWTAKTRIVLDIGMPLVEKDGSEFDFTKYSKDSLGNLIDKKILPDIKGFYDNNNALVDGVVISHPHIDHFGLSNYIHPEVKFYLGEGAHKIIELTGIFTPQQNAMKHVNYFEKSIPFKIGDFTVTPYWMDHAAFDAYALLIEAGGKSIFYSGDFRGHGRKHKAFKYFLRHAPKNVDYLLMEGTQIERNTKVDKRESEIENELVDVFSAGDEINFICVSGQNIDRLVSIYRACRRTGKLFVVDVYIATVLKALAEFAAIPYPSSAFPDLRVIFSHYLCKRLADENNEKLLYQFKNSKISKEEISANKKNIVMTVRPSMRFDLDRIPGIDGGNLIFSMWEGYLKKDYTSKFVDYLKTRNFKVFKIHTSGHADIETLKKMTDAVSPKCIIPIHTFRGNEYADHFNYPVREVSDGEEVVV